MGSEVDRRSAARAGAAAGVLGAGVGVLVSAGMHTIWPSFPFPPVVVAERVAMLVPGRVASSLIDVLQHSDKPVAVASTALALGAIAAGLGRFLPRLAPRVPGGVLGAAGLLSLPLYAVAVGSLQPDSVSVSRAVYGLALIPVFALSAWATARAFSRVPPERVVDPARRNVLVGAGLGGAGLILGWADLGRVLFPGPNPGRLALRVGNLTTATPPLPAAGDAAFADVAGLAARVTPTADHYVVNEEFVDPVIDPSTWRLAVKGAVGRPFELTYAELLDMPVVERFQTLECISNPVGGDLISTANWAGVPLQLLLDRAGVLSEAVEVVSRAVTGFSDSLPLEQAMLPTTLVAIGMNGNVLPREHGYPARLLVPGLYGMKQPKWLREFEVVTTPYVGYWEHRGWIKAAVVKTTSRIDVADPAAGGVLIAGVAFAGDRGISRVEMSRDAGRTWQEAELETGLSDITWRRWLAPLPQASQGSDYRVRATDGDGNLQIAQISTPFPSGATGYDMRSIGG